MQEVLPDPIVASRPVVQRRQDDVTIVPVATLHTPDASHKREVNTRRVGVASGKAAELPAASAKKRVFTRCHATLNEHFYETEPPRFVLILAHLPTNSTRCTNFLPAGINTHSTLSALPTNIDKPRAPSSEPASQPCTIISRRLLHPRGTPPCPRTCPQPYGHHAHTLIHEQSPANPAHTT